MTHCHSYTDIHLVATQEMMTGLNHECGNCGHVWRTTGFSIECTDCGHMRGVARPDGFQRGRQTEQPDELAELITLWEGGMLEGLF